MTNLGGHDLEAMLEAFHGVADDRPHCFIAYTVKGWGLPLAGHKDNHAGLMTPEQMAALRRAHGVPPAQEWSTDAGLDAAPRDNSQAFLDRRALTAAAIERYDAGAGAGARDAAAGPPRGAGLDAGGVRADHGRARAQRPAAGRADRHHLARRHRLDRPRPAGSAGARCSAAATTRTCSAPSRWSRRTPWRESRTGQHLELGIAENNLFLNLASLGLAHDLFGARLLPVGTLYDPFIARGLDALNYACYQDARFLLVATPSGITLAPGGRRPPVDRHAADRHQPARPDLVRAGLRRRGGGDAALGLRAPAGAGRRLGLSAPVAPARSPSPSAR